MILLNGNIFFLKGPLRPGKVSAKLFVPEHIKKPDYALSGVPNEEIQNRSQPIEVKSKEEIQNMRDSCVIGIKIKKNRF